jgi:EAL domain-containing protein (putative c-di-GMP-specific phosphodiesterase class I)
MDISNIYSNQYDTVQKLLKIQPDGFATGVYQGIQFSSVFQPIFNQQLELVALEGLARIKHTSGRKLEPARYFADLERQVEINVVCTILCCKLHLHNFSCSCFRRRKLFLNVSPCVFELLANEPLAIERFMTRIGEFGAMPSQIVFEITEFKESDIRAIVVGKGKLAKFGVQTALDDYGTDYSTKDRALEIKADYLKLDRSVLLCDEKISEAVTTANKIGATTVAEGIENQDTLTRCQLHGVSLFQGFGLAKPNAMKILESNLD